MVSADAPGDGEDVAEDLSIETVIVDFYMAAPLPTNALDKLPCSPCYTHARQVPVMRVFGATPAGQKACVHIHGLFPYFYFRTENDPVFDDPEELHRLLPRIALELEQANEARQRQQQQQNGTTNNRAVSESTPKRRAPPAKLVAKLVVVQATSIYGFDAEPRLFVQIFLYNPRAVGSTVQLLESGRITERVFQPYEAHVPFLLQVFADYHIEGMNAIHLAHVKFRAPLPTTQGHLQGNVLLKSNVPSIKINGDVQSVAQRVTGRFARAPEFPAHWFDRESICALELDVAAGGILNPQRFRRLQASLAAAGELRSVPSLAALWEEERLRRIANGERSTPELSLGVERDDAVAKPQRDDAQGAASALLSQSFFRQQMEDSVAEVVKRYRSELDQSPSGSASSSVGSSGHTQGHSALAVGHNSNSIDAESAFSFSQSDTDALPTASDEQDQAIVDLLLAMQRSPEEPPAADACATDEDASDEDEGGLVEIADILASQAIPDTVDTNEQQENRPWWDVDEAQVKLSASSSVLDLGSPRVDWAKPATQRIGKRKPRQSIEQEETEELAAADDLLPPPPPAARRRKRRLVLQKQEDEVEEDSVPFDPLVLSLTPPPRLPQAKAKRTLSTTATRTGQPVSSVSNNAALPTESRGRALWLFAPPPPAIEELCASSKTLGVHPIEHRSAFFSSIDDLPEKSLVFSGQKFVFSPQDLAHTPPFDTRELRRLLQPDKDLGHEQPTASLRNGTVTASLEVGRVHRIRTPVCPPPSATDIARWCSNASSAPSPSRAGRDPVATTTTPESLRAGPRSNLTVLSLEVFACSRGALLPDPRYDAVDVVAYAVEAQEGTSVSHKTKVRGVLLRRQPDADGKDAGGCEDLGFSVGGGTVEWSVAVDERALFAQLEELVRRWDPDFFVGFEVQKESLGYLVDRAAHLQIPLVQTLSRLPSTPVDARNAGSNHAFPEDAEGDDHDDDSEQQQAGAAGPSIGTTWGVTKASGLWIHGRHVLNLWRLARSEVKLSKFAREDVVRAVLRREWPVFAGRQLSDWFHGASLASRWRVVRHTLRQATCNLRLLAKLQMLTRTSEMARLFGMDFYSVLSRGSQFRVESMMLRVAKRRGLLLLSPNRTQVARQAPMECIPLVMEPHSAFYADPVVVLDFQSLYPSLVIAYNLCFSTIYGRLRDGRHAPFDAALGVLDAFSPSAATVVRDTQRVLSPNGVVVASAAQRRGVLPEILDEILATRIMVKRAMQTARARGQTRLAKVLDARQLALKLLANVTYGYTAAGFSGRMPCAPLADAIVQSGRCTLEAAVRMVESHPHWHARVVYGDTDSLFVLLRGRSRAQAFAVGAQIAHAVTAANPAPVTLKLEKVYLGCVLVSKKRYVGRKFESPTQATGELEAKGVEIVRRDSCGVVQTAMAQCLSQLFATSDLSRVRQALETLWLDMLEDKLPLRAFVFAKEVRLGTYARGSAPPAALVSAKAMARDPRAEPRYAERVAYLVVNGAPGARLQDLVVSPDEFARERHTINYQYYIHKQLLPSLERLLLLLGANAREWFARLPRVATKAKTAAAAASIDAFYASRHCRLCGAMGHHALCDDCARQPQRSEYARRVATARRERELALLRRVCLGCAERDALEACGNVSCGVWNRAWLAQRCHDQEDFAVEW